MMSGRRPCYLSSILLRYQLIMALAPPGADDVLAACHLLEVPRAA